MSSGICTMNCAAASHACCKHVKQHARVTGRRWKLLNWLSKVTLLSLASLQALLANMAAMYAVYHGPQGLKEIANRVHGLAAVFAAGLKTAGLGTVSETPFFDTVKVSVPGKAKELAQAAVSEGMNIRIMDPNTVCGVRVQLADFAAQPKLQSSFVALKPATI